MKKLIRKWLGISGLSVSEKDAIISGLLKELKHPYNHQWFKDQIMYGAKRLVKEEIHYDLVARDTVAEIVKQINELQLKG